MKKTLFLLLSITTYINGQNPEEVVKTVITSLTNGKIEEVIKLTEKSELRKAQEILTAIGDSDKKRQDIIHQYKMIKSWKILDSRKYEINNRVLFIVNTEWLVSPGIETIPGTVLKNQKDLKDKKFYVDYMLEKFDNQWKIISRKALN